MTPHIEAKEGEIAKIVLMPGDPMRAKFIAETYLDAVKLVNRVRGMYAYTGLYKGKEITVMASGMGMPSMGIYSYELYQFYHVDTIIRIGSAGAYVEDLNLFDVVLAKDVYSESSYAKTQNGCSDTILSSTKELNDVIKVTAQSRGQTLHIGTVHSSDVFYRENNPYLFLSQKYGCLAVEMESFALFHNANLLGKRAACLLTISDSFISHQETTSEQREKSFTDMVILALESVLAL
ncbi:MAG: purine-nucleoside phosphorylase [Bacilli bacterium]|nr:purine-nucleoside phosphorylase [Bacilli bacterium]